jgi:hypothetical protein
VCSLLNFSRAILTSDFDVRTFKPIRDRLNSREDRCNYDFTMIGIRDKWLQSECRFDSVAKRLVHLPVSGYYGFTHKLRGLWPLVIGFGSLDLDV